MPKLLMFNKKDNSLFGEFDFMQDKYAVKATDLEYMEIGKTIDVIDKLSKNKDINPAEFATEYYDTMKRAEGLIITLIGKKQYNAIVKGYGKKVDGYFISTVIAVCLAALNENLLKEAEAEINKELKLLNNV